MKFKKTIIILIIIFIFISSPIVDANDTENNNLNIYSNAVILVDNTTGEVLYEKNSTQQLYPASTTKIITAIIALEKCDLNSIVTVSRSAVLSVPSGYSSAYLSEGEEISVIDLLQLLLVHSANDAGFVLAEYISGSTEEFANLMNEKAVEIGCKNTHFTNPSGIHNKDHYSTAYDLSLIARYCMKNHTFRDIVAMESCSINPTNKYGVRKYSNTNDLILQKSKYYLPDCIGIKTGFTSEAQNCLITCFSKDGLELIAIILGATYTENGESARATDAHTLYNYGYENYSLTSVASAGDVAYSLDVSNGSKDTKKLDLLFKEDIKILMKKNDILPDPKITFEKSISAPISQNSTIGTISYEINGVTYSSPLIASHDVKTSSLLLVILIVLLLIIVFLFIIRYINLSNRKKKKRRAKYRIRY